MSGMARGQIPTDQAATIARRGLMLVLSSPSGAGKTTLSRMLLDADVEVELSVSVTTRYSEYSWGRNTPQLPISCMACAAQTLPSCSVSFFRVPMALDFPSTP